MAEQRTVSGLKELVEVVKQKQGEGKRVYVLYSGSKDESGQSWCPDCVAADPHIRKYLSAKGTDDQVLLTAEVGDRPQWKDQKNEFRTHPDIRIVNIPTLMRWGKRQMLVEGDCLDDGKLDMLFEEED